jgi:hypothetical protein
MASFSANMIWLSPFHKIKKLPRRLTVWLTAGTDLASQYNHYGTIVRKCAAYHRGEAPVLATYLIRAILRQNSGHYPFVKNHAF